MERCKHCGVVPWEGGLYCKGYARELHRHHDPDFLVWPSIDNPMTVADVIDACPDKCQGDD